MLDVIHVVRVPCQVMSCHVMSYHAMSYECHACSVAISLLMCTCMLDVPSHEYSIMEQGANSKGLKILFEWMHR